MKHRIGFACKFLHPDQTLSKAELEEIQRPLNTKATTVSWLQHQSKKDAESRLWEITVHNLNAIKNLIAYVSTLPPNLHMVRLGSDILPVYTHSDFRNFWAQPSIISYLEKRFAEIGDFARSKDIRLSFHPGQFVVLASDSDDIVARSIEEFEYHVNMARWMGYGKSFQDFKINVHIAGKRGPDGIKAVIPKLSPEARNCLTIENDEMKWGIDSSLELVNHCALVLDIHHHFIHTKGEYISPFNDKFKKIIDSWRGVRPVIHYSVSRDEHVKNHPRDDFIQYSKLISEGVTKTQLRAHSDWYPNTKLNDWALGFLNQADIMCESKMKNLASIELYEYWLSKQPQLPQSVIEAS